MIQKHKLEIFKQNHLFNKDELQQSFSAFIDHYQTSDEKEYSTEKRINILELCEKFKNALDKCRLPEMKDNWWFYQYDLTNDGINLTLNFCDDFEVDSDNEIISMTSSEEATMISVKCDYLTVEQYAEAYDVTSTTVRQWIRRGKLRSAQKAGRDWLIPSIADKPKRGYENVTYFWSHLPLMIRNEFPFLDGYECIYIFQDEQDKSKFNCIMGWPQSDNRTKETLETRERERLELLLISHPNVDVKEFKSGIVFMPCIK